MNGGITVDWRTMLYILWCVSIWPIAIPLYPIHKRKPISYVWSLIERADDFMQNKLKPNI